MKLFLPLFALLCLLTASPVFSQSPETIASDRPGNAYTSTVVGKGVFQGQDGLEFGQSKDEYKLTFINGGLPSSYNLNSSTYALTNYFRLGIGNKSEINGIVDFRNNRTEIDGTDSNNNQSSTLITQQGLSKLGIGFRQNIIEEKGNLPALGVLINTYFNGLLDDHRISNPDGFLLILAQKQLSNIFSFTTNLGFNYGDFLNDGDFIDSYLYTLNLGYSITPKLSGYVEAYGQIVNGDIIDAYDAGFGFLINKNVQLDLYGGIYTDQNYFEYFVSTGISWRVGNL
ncbi:transporter [Hyphobacterium sp. CCMP332]|nr:transporter [Hyphobacterium sp. CCMP332]